VGTRPGGIAYHRCRKSKIKCINTGGDAPCETCIRNGKECTYPEATPAPPKRPDPPTGVKTDGVAERKKLRKIDDISKIDSSIPAAIFAEEVLSASYLSETIWSQVFESPATSLAYMTLKQMSNWLRMAETYVEYFRIMVKYYEHVKQDHERCTGKTLSSNPAEEGTLSVCIGGGGLEEWKKRLKVVKHGEILPVDDERSELGTARWRGSSVGDDDSYHAEQTKTPRSKLLAGEPDIPNIPTYGSWQEVGEFLMTAQSLPWNLVPGGIDQFAHGSQDLLPEDSGNGSWGSMSSV